MKARGARSHPLFDQPHARARVGFWSRASSLELDEATALSFGLDPKFIKPATIDPYSGDDRSEEYRDRRFLIDRAFKAGRFGDRISPVGLFSWMRSNHLSPPPDFTTEIERLAAFERVEIPAPIANHDVQTLLEAIEKLRKSSELQVNERRSVMLMIGTLAKQNGYRAGAERQKSTSKIRDALLLEGLDLDPKTILKYCDEGWATIEKELAAQGVKRKS